MHLFNNLLLTFNKNSFVYEEKLVHLLQLIRKTSYLFWNLTKIINEANGGVFLEGVVNTVDVHISLVEQMMEHID